VVLQQRQRRHADRQHRQPEHEPVQPLLRVHVRDQQQVVQHHLEEAHRLLAGLERPEVAEVRQDDRRPDRQHPRQHRRPGELLLGQRADHVRQGHDRAQEDQHFVQRQVLQRRHELGRADEQHRVEKDEQAKCH
jgi:hypothetical protein